MARPIKKGLDYFPFDVDMDQDDKIQLIEGEFGLKGFAIIVKLLTKIYDNGFYYPWRDKEKLLFARRVGKENGSLVNEVVSRSVKWELFNQHLFNKSSILTSKAIQQRYFKAIKRRKNITIPAEYLLVDKNHIPEGVNVNKNLVNGNKNTPKESKGKKSKSRTRVNGCPIPEPLQEVEGFKQKYKDYCEYMEQQYNHWPNSQVTEEDLNRLTELKQEGNDPIKVIRQTIQARNKSFYKLKEDYSGNGDQDSDEDMYNFGGAEGKPRVV